MPASKAEQVLAALEALLKTVSGAVTERNSVLPEKVPDGGLIILRDGDPGEPEQALGGFGSTYYRHAIEVERCTSKRAKPRSGMPPLTTSCSRSELRSTPISRSAASPPG